MKIGYNYINSFIIFILVLLFTLFVYSDNNSILGTLILLISFISGSVFLYLKRKKNSIICFYLFTLFTFYWVSNKYADNYSIKSLIDEYKLNENDSLKYKILIKTNNELNKCKINGDYDKKNKNITENYSNDILCNNIKKNLGNKFIHGINIDNSENIDNLENKSNENNLYLIIPGGIILSIILIIFLISRRDSGDSNSSENSKDSGNNK